MTEHIDISRNIKQARIEKGMTQREVSRKADISISQLSAYENGKQVPGLTTLAKLATALGTSLDRLYFGRPSEAFLNETADFGETVVNCFLRLRELGVVSDVQYSEGGGGGTVYLVSCGYELNRMFSQIREYEYRKAFYPDGDSYLEQIYKSVANEINTRNSRT